MTRSYLGYVSSQTTDTIVVQGYGTATGGTTLGSPPAGYTVLEFTSSGTLTVTKAGLFDVMASSMMLSPTHSHHLKSRKS
jgi:hypothetical protein